MSSLISTLFGRLLLHWHRLLCLLPLSSSVSSPLSAPSSSPLTSDLSSPPSSYLPSLLLLSVFLSDFLSVFCLLHNITLPWSSSSPYLPLEQEASVRWAGLRFTQPSANKPPFQIPLLFPSRMMPVDRSSNTWTLVMGAQASNLL